MRFLVTGGAGYVGSTVADELIKAGHQVTVLDNLLKGHRAAVPPGAVFVKGDVADQFLLRGLFARGAFDGVLHFAALIEAGESMKYPEQFFRNNSATTLVLLETMLEFNVKRFVFSSTAALYGNPEKTPIEEDARLQPSNAYGESKLIVEQMLRWLHRIHGLRYASLRYFNAAGATPARGENHQPETHLIPRILQVPLGAAQQVKIFGADYDTPDGTCIRDYIHILDLASAHVLAAEALAERDCMIYNLGNGAGFSIREVIDAARGVTGHPIPAVEEARRPGDPGILIASSERIRRELGWTPRFTSLDAIIETAWKWHQSHPEGYGRA
ncbi:MAG: UDP-glucose 4-epimerase GalE [Bryobacterales bacterium]|nr:UDP-glucose 4-epimerase GalE [Bryobacterales bacterium]